MARIDSFGLLTFVSLISSQYTDFTKVVEFILKYSLFWVIQKMQCSYRFTFRCFLLKKIATQLQCTRVFFLLSYFWDRFLPQILICALESCLDAALATEKAGDSAAATLTLSFALVIAITTTSREKNFKLFLICERFIQNFVNFYMYFIWLIAFLLQIS